MTQGSFPCALWFTQTTESTAEFIVTMVVTTVMTYRMLCREHKQIFPHAHRTLCCYRAVSTNKQLLTFLTAHTEISVVLILSLLVAWMNHQWIICRLVVTKPFLWISVRAGSKVSHPCASLPSSSASSRCLQESRGQSVLWKSTLIHFQWNATQGLTGDFTRWKKPGL